MIKPLQGNEARLVRTLRRIAALASVGVALWLPAFYFTVGHRGLVSALSTEVDVSADILSRAINNNPEMWRYEQHRLKDVLDRRAVPGVPELRRILDASGRVVEESSDGPSPPTVSRSAVLYDSGAAAGRVEIARSIRGLMLESAGVGVLGILLGAGVYAVLLLFPMRLLRRALVSLDREKERSHVTLHAIGEAVISTDEDGRVRLMNSVAEELTGWTAGAAEGRPLGEVFRTVDDRTGEPLPDRLKRLRDMGGEGILGGRALQSSRSGQMRRIAESSAPIREGDGTLRGMVVVFRDVTAEQRMEEELQKAQKLESVGTLAGGIAHDFNNILTAILGNVSLAAEQVDPGSPAGGRLAEAAGACRRARDLTSQLLTFSRGGAPVRRTLDLDGLVREAAGFATVGSSARCEFELPAGLWTADVDEGQISQVVHNLVLNAVQAMPGGGTIRIRATNAEVTGRDGLSVEPGRYVKVSVRDEGTGIRPEHLPNLFDPYFTTRRKGSGLGLSVCFNVVRNHGGCITASSGPGKGATFEFWLPAGDRPPAESPAEAGRPPRGNGRILAMDDDEGILDVLGEMLAHLGYEPVFARDGAEAVRLYREGWRPGGRIPRSSWT